MVAEHRGHVVTGPQELGHPARGGEVQPAGRPHREALPRQLPSGPLIVGYTGCDQQKVLAEAAKGVNVIIWFASNLVRNATTGQPQVATGLNHTCVAEVAQELRRRRLPTAHMLCVGGWDAPHPNTSFSGQQWFEAWDEWNRREAARPALGFAGYDGIDCHL